VAQKLKPDATKRPSRRPGGVLAPDDVLASAGEMLGDDSGVRIAAALPSALATVGPTRIQRRVVAGPQSEPLSVVELDRVRLAVERGAEPERGLLRLGQFVDDTRAWTLAEVLVELGLTEGSLPSAQETATIRRGGRAGFEFSKSVKYERDPWTMSFVRDETTLNGHDRGKPVYLVEQERLQAPVVIRGYRSEDEKPEIAKQRAEEVHRMLEHAGYTSQATVDAKSEGTKGNFDYREMRRVEVRPVDHVQPQKLDDGRVLSSDSRYQKYGIIASLDGGQQLIDGAVSKLKSINASSPEDNLVMATFRRFFSTADPTAVVANLELARAQIEHYRPEAPPDANAPEGGHACLDESRPGLFYVNEGTGKEARMVAGVLSLTATPNAKAYNVVHEATHGAPALQTRDHAYVWQRLFPFLTPDLQISNADSYAMLVGTLAGMSQAQPGMSEKEAEKYDIPAAAEGTVATAGVSPQMQGMLAATWAWLQHYTTQLYLNFRDLYPNVASGVALVPTSYQGKLYEATAEVFGLGPAEFATIAGIVDRLDDLNGYATRTVPYYFAQPPSAHPGERYDAIILPSTLSPDQRAVMQFQLDLMFDSVHTIRPDLRSTYRKLFTRVVPMSRWGGPLG
jgi:hypothetical protein